MLMQFAKKSCSRYYPVKINTLALYNRAAFFATLLLQRPGAVLSGTQAASPSTMPACLGREVLPVWLEGGFDTRRERLVFVGLLLLGWLTLNVGLHFFSLYAVSERIGFDFPLFYTMWHMVISFGGSSLLIFGFRYA